MKKLLLIPLLFMSLISSPLVYAEEEFKIRGKAADAIITSNNKQFLYFDADRNQSYYDVFVGGKVLRCSVYWSDFHDGLRSICHVNSEN